MPAISFDVGSAGARLFACQYSGHRSLL